MNRTYGGFLPLELNDGKEYFCDYESKLQRFNSVKAALDYVIKKIGVTKIYIPIYYCPSTTQALQNMHSNVVFYHIDETFSIEKMPDEANVAIILVNYFGCLEKQIKEIVKQLKNAVVIIDNAHAFFSSPIIKNKVWNIYSAKKFFGVPDGAYAISLDIVCEKQKLSTSYDYSSFLLLSYEKGTNEAYALKKESDKIIASRYDSMSKLAQGILKNVNYDDVKKKRVDNWRALCNGLSDINELGRLDECAGYLYPLLISNGGDKVKRYLVNNKIFVPTLWNGEALMKKGNDFELNLSRNGVFLPVDQRYNVDDMKYIIKTIKET